MEENIIVTRDPNTFCFNFDWTKDADLKNKIEFIIKNNETLVEKKMKTRLSSHC